MANKDINTVKDASGKTINDYKAAYAEAAKNNDAAGMKAANDAANAIRSSNNVATESASSDINKVASGGTSGMVSNPSRWDSGSSSSSKTTGSVPAGYTGSSNAVGTYTEDQDAIKAQMNANSIKWHTAPDGDASTPGTKQWYEQQNKDLAAQLGAGVTFDPVSGYWSGNADKPVVQQPTVQTQLPGANKASSLDTNGLQNLLDQWKAAAQKQSENTVDYGVQKAVLDLQRALEDANAQFKEQQEHVARDEMQSLDNSALYSEMRGDKGGIGEEQYSSIMNTAAQNRLTIQQAQTKMATDTQRQIADLRAQGEFEKADAVLEIAQTYLSQLINLEQWAAEYNLSAAQFNESIRQWEAEFQQAVQQYQDSQELAIAELTGKFSNGATTLQAQQLITKQLASSGESLLAYGVMPSDEQLDAMGMTKAQAQQLITAAQLQSAQDAAKKGNGGNGGGDGTANLQGLGLTELYQHLFDEGYTNKSEASIKSYLLSKGYTSTQANAYAAAYVSEQYKALKNAAELEGSGAGTPTTLSSDAEAIKRKILSIPGLTEENKVAIIIEAAKNGLSEADELALYDYFKL